MSRQPRVTARQIIQDLLGLGFTKARHNKHACYCYGNRKAIIPIHGKKTLAAGTLKEILLTSGCHYLDGELRMKFDEEWWDDLIKHNRVPEHIKSLRKTFSKSDMVVWAKIYKDDDVYVGNIFSYPITYDELSEEACLEALSDIFHDLVSHWHSIGITFRPLGKPNDPDYCYPIKIKPELAKKLAA